MLDRSLKEENVGVHLCFIYESVVNSKIIRTLFSLQWWHVGGC